MNYVLILKDELWKDCHIKDCLSIGGNKVEEINIQHDTRDIENRFARKDIVIVACVNPGMFIEVVQMLKQFTDLPMIVVAKTNDDWAKIKMIHLGVMDYITIPVNEMEFIARVTLRIEHYKRMTKIFGIIKTRDLIIDIMSRKVYIKDRQIMLTTKEFDTLLYLAQHGNNTVTKEELYCAVWKTRFVETGCNAVQTYVKRVRAKIEKTPDNPQYIETVWGIGYRFIL